MSLIEVKVPDIGDYKNVPIIEIHVKPGDVIKADDPLITLESDKAAMEVPAPSGGKVESIEVKVGDKVSAGSFILRLADSNASAAAAPAAAAPKAEAPKAAAAKAAPAAKNAIGDMPAPPAIPREVPPPPVHDYAGVHASPAVRRLARELDVDLTALKGSGEKSRITKDKAGNSLIELDNGN